MKKKILIGLGIIAIAVLAVFGLQALLPKNEAQVGNKQLNIVVVDSSNGENVLFEGSIKTDAETLGDALAGAPELKMVTEDSTYGRYIQSLCGVAQGPQESGPWWLYESDNNESCKAQGMCMSIDETVINDGDNFKFNLTSSFN